MFAKSKSGCKGCFSDSLSFNNPTLGRLADYYTDIDDIVDYYVNDTVEYTYFIPKVDYLKLQDGVSVEEIIESYNTIGKKMDDFVKQQLQKLFNYLVYHPKYLKVGKKGYFFDDWDDLNKIEQGDWTSFHEGHLAGKEVQTNNEGKKWASYFIDESNNAWGYFISLDDFEAIMDNNFSANERITLYEKKSTNNDGSVRTSNKNNNNTIGEKNMNSNEMLSNLVTMKMVDAMSKGGDMDIGKLMLMQSLTKGQPIKITDVIKSKIISNLKLDGDDLPLEKVMLLQMLDEGELDVNQLITFKMIGSMFEEKKEK